MHNKISPSNFKFSGNYRSIAQKLRWKFSELISTETGGTKNYSNPRKHMIHLNSKNINLSCYMNLVNSAQI